jgi:aspartate/methionine/tyrosine aminotransferase
MPSLRKLADGPTDALVYYSNPLLSGVISADLEVDAVAADGPDVINLALESPTSETIAPSQVKLPVELRSAATALPELQQAIVQEYSMQMPGRSAPLDALVTPGIRGGLRIVMQALANRGDRVAALSPCPPTHKRAVESRGVKLLPVAAHAEQGRLRFNVPELIRALRQAKLLLLQSPANPTGSILTTEDMDQIVWWCDRHDTLLVWDEAYAAYNYDVAPPLVLGLPRAAARTLCAGSVSALAAYDVGWLAGSRALIRPCQLAAQWLDARVPTHCQRVALAALAMPKERMTAHREAFRDRRQYVIERLRSMGLSPCWPGGGYFVWTPIAELNMDASAFAERALREKRVLVTPGSLFGTPGAGHIRISFAVEDGRLREGLNRLAQMVRTLAPLAAAA